MKFASLHNQTQYSILDSIIKTKDLFHKAKELDYPAVAITDHGSLGAAWEGLKYSRETGVKLIIGCELYFEDESSDKTSHIVLLARNSIGYKNLLTLNKLGFDNNIYDGKKVNSKINWDLLKSYSDGLICLTACGNGIISRQLMSRDFDKASEYLLRLKSIFNDNLGLEILPNNMKRGANYASFEIDQTFINRQLINLGRKHNIKIVAACNAHYINQEDHSVHDVLLSIGSHQPAYSNFRLKYNVPDFYLKSGEEVFNFFKRNYGEDSAKEFVENSLYFADMCEFPDWIDPKFSNPSGKELPHFPVKDQPDYLKFKEWCLLEGVKYAHLDEDMMYLRYACYTSFDKEKHKLPEDQIQVYLDRIDYELDILEYQGFSSYMLIVADFISWAENNNISVGPGRGSAGGSYVAYLLGIHKADSIRYDLIFERFQNKFKTSFPDIDSDIATSRRDEVISYVRNKYGDDNVCSISNFNAITAKVYARDLSRALELGGSKDKATEIGNELAAIIPSEIGKPSSIQSLLSKIPLLAEYSKTKYPEIEKYGSIIGSLRATSQHAAGIIISDRNLVGLAPLRRDKSGALVIEYDKDISEENGFVKMDFLGLSTLDIISATIREIKKSGKSFNNEHLDYDANDELTYDLISRGDTYGVFQFGTSAGTVDLCKKIKPKNIEDLAIITCLARPAARDIREAFIATKNGKKAAHVLHPSVNNAFSKTYGFGLFDESILQLGRDVAGWNLNDADRLRKMIKEKGKNPAKDKKLQAEFIEGAINNGIEPTMAQRIWTEEVGKFASYTFNKSHSILYSMVSYQTAYLKAHFPIEFLLANLMAEVGSSAPTARANIAKIKKEIRQNNVKVIPPDINKSQLTYVISEGDKLITGLDALKFVSDDAINDIIQKRPFKDFNDFMTRVDSKKVRSNAIQALAAAGALDCFNIPRKHIFLYVSDYRKRLQEWLKKHDPNTETFTYPWVKEPEWSIAELYALEQFYIGESFICKPAKAYTGFFPNDHKLIADIMKANNKTAFPSLRAIVKDFFAFSVKKETSKFYGQSMAKVVIEDKNGDECTMTIFPDRWALLQKKLKQVSKKAEFEVGLAMHFGGTANEYEDNMGVILDNVYAVSLPPALPADLKQKRVVINKTKSEKPTNLVDELEDSLYDQGLIDIE